MRSARRTNEELHSRRPSDPLEDVSGRSDLPPKLRPRREAGVHEGVRQCDRPIGVRARELLRHPVARQNGDAAERRAARLAGGAAGARRADRVIQLSVAIQVTDRNGRRPKSIPCDFSLERQQQRAIRARAQADLTLLLNLAGRADLEVIE